MRPHIHHCPSSHGKRSNDKRCAVPNNPTPQPLLPCLEASISVVGPRTPSSALSVWRGGSHFSALTPSSLWATSATGSEPPASAHQEEMKTLLFLSGLVAFLASNAYEGATAERSTQPATTLAPADSFNRNPASADGSDDPDSSSYWEYFEAWNRELSSTTIQPCSSGQIGCCCTCLTGATPSTCALALLTPSIPLLPQALKDTTKSVATA